MLFYSLRRKIRRKLIEHFNFYRVQFTTAHIKPSGKSIYVDVSHLALNRYLYCFLKFFYLNGYTVYLPKNKKVINTLSRDKGEFQFANGLLKEDFVKFGVPSKREKTIFISKEQLSNDYFSDFFNDTLSQNRYHVPMCQYPSIYSELKFEEKISLEKRRKRVIFMAGNMDRRYYHAISENKRFNILSRVAIADFIFSKNYYYPINSQNELEEFIRSKMEEKVVLIDAYNNFRIPGGALKRTLAGFDFYLALPGIIIPQSHNLIEAMAVGCIPIIHSTYAKLFRPFLEHELNAIIFESLEELDVEIKKLFKLPEDEVVLMRKNVVQYYFSNLTPKAVVENIEENDFSKIYIQAESRSIACLNK